jgi:hypothetical protein
MDIGFNNTSNKQGTTLRHRDSFSSSGNSTTRIINTELLSNKSTPNEKHFRFSNAEELRKTTLPSITTHLDLSYCDGLRADGMLNQIIQMIPLFDPLSYVTCRFEKS